MDGVRDEAELATVGVEMKNQCLQTKTFERERRWQGYETAHQYEWNLTGLRINSVFAESQ